MKKIILFVFIGFVSLSVNLKAEGLPSKDEAVRILRNVNDYWQDSHPVPGWSFWEHAAYHTGNMEAFYVTGIQRYLDYSIYWSELNEWKGAKSDDPTRWRYHYGESDDFVLFGDWQTCFQTFIDIYNIKGDELMIARTIEVMEYQMQTDTLDYLWWADGLYMVMPVMTKLYKLTGNEQYLHRLADYFDYAVSIMYDEETGLFFRDGRYVYPEHKSVNEKKDFWARGVGWVFAGLAKVLQDLSPDDHYRDVYLNHYLELAAGLAECQQEGGYWTRSLLDPEHAPGYETSGTAFFTYAYLWGMNNGVLDKDEYMPVALNAWQYLTEIALQENGRVGYIQPIGDRAIPGQVINENSTANFGVGAFLLAVSEMIRMIPGDMPFFMESVKLIENQQLLVQFNYQLDPVSASNVNNYKIDGIAVSSATVTDSGFGVVLSLIDLPAGRYALNVNGLKNTTGMQIMGNEAMTFLYAGVTTVTASSYEPGSINRPECTLDFNLNTRWSAYGSGEWILFDLQDVNLVTSLDVAFFRGDERHANFMIEISVDGENFTDVFNGSSSGMTIDPERYEFDPANVRYVKITTYGNSQNLWNSITQVIINTSSTTSLLTETLDLDTFLMYPNPISGSQLYFFFSQEVSIPILVQIFDLSGKLCFRQTLQNNGHIAQLSGLNLTSGLYHVQVHLNELTTRSLLVQ